MDIRFTEDFGNHKAYAKLNGMDRLTKRAVRKGMFLWARDLKATANSAILDKASKTGRTYLIRNRRDGGKLSRARRHRASAPLQTHANITGSLRRSIGWRVTSSDSLTFGYGVDGKNVPAYGEFLEFGTFKMVQRPSLQNAIRDTTGNAETYFNGELKRLGNEN